MNHRGKRSNIEEKAKGFSDSDKSVKKGEVSFIFESFSTKKDLNKIQELINQKNKFASFLKSEIIKLNYLDIGILTVKYLLQNYYKTKLELSNKEGEQVIQFKLPCDLEILTGSNNSRYFFYGDLILNYANYIFHLDLLIIKDSYYY